MPCKPVPGENKQAAFCWHRSLNPFREHWVCTSESHRCECPQNVPLNRGDKKFSHNRDDITAVPTYFCKLSLVESRPGLQLVMPFVTSQGVHLELEQINLQVMKRRGHEHYLQHLLVVILSKNNYFFLNRTSPCLHSEPHWLVLLTNLSIFCIC